MLPIHANVCAPRTESDTAFRSAFSAETALCTDALCTDALCTDALCTEAPCVCLASSYQGMGLCDRSGRLNIAIPVQR